MLFTDLKLNPDLQRGIDDLGFTDCTDVQAATFTHTLNGRDVAVQSQTGTGKTAAFLITIFQLMNESEQFRGTRALIVAPTRELAVQIENDAKLLGKYLPQRSICIYGGVGYAPQEKALADKVEIVIGTPGRLLDFHQSRKLDFKEMGIVVVDEADRLFDMGFYPDIRRIMRGSRPREERLTLLYSATLSTNVRNISWQFMNDPKEIEITPERMTVEKVTQQLYHVSMEEKFRLLLGLLKRDQPETSIVFCNTKRATEIVAKKLQMCGYNTEFIIGDLPQKKRLSIIERMKAGEIRILCATDVAARGLHVDDIDIVFNYDIPEDAEAYVHRIGRTARAGREGRAVAFACERFVYGLEAIETLIGSKIPTAVLSDELLEPDPTEGKRLPTTHFDDRPPRKPSRRGARTPRSSESGLRPSERKQSDSHRHAPGRTRPDDAKRPARSGDRRSRPAAAHHPRAAATGPRDSGPREAWPREAVTREAGPSRTAPMGDRIEYYRKKYGEDFAPASGGASGGSSGSRPAGGKPPARDDRGGSDTPAARKPDDAAEARRPRKGVLARLTGLFRKEGE
ncbi:MAG: DEAD/DEAH box helicase [Spirochaetaceae bacterium]|nr:MAG: DEAD/DEAH box helicase [Spirochaetaceae bacterium]